MHLLKTILMVLWVMDWIGARQDWKKASKVALALIYYERLYPGQKSK